MILIISQNYIDAPTDYVYDWLKYLGVECERLNGIDLLGGMDFEIGLESTKDQMRWGAKKLNLANVKSIWIRRWVTAYDFKKIDFVNDESIILNEIAQGSNVPLDKKKSDGILSSLAMDINEHIEGEFRGLSQYFFELIENKPTLGNRFYAGKDPSKAKQLIMAAKVGLVVPATIITDSKARLQDFKGLHGDIISKNISEIGFFHFLSSAASYTHLMTDHDINELPELFFPALFQKAVDKIFEIRTFVLGDNLYSMAIFSGNDSRTEIDFRRYNNQNPNRNIPFQLPSEVEDQIRKFMRLSGLSTGSIDLIYSKSNEYIFLEVNPVGQFSMVSTPCNYNLEKQVAEHLIKLSEYE